MPSHLHEALLLLFRNRPSLAPELLRDALHIELPAHTEVRLDSAELTDIQPAEYRADLVVLLLNEVPVLGIIVEVQLAADERKRFVWPAYVVNLRARLECPVCLLVVTADERVAHWAAKPIELGGGNPFTPFVLGPSGVPEVTDEAHACADPELAVLSAMAHGQDRDTEKSLRIAFAAQAASVGLDEDRARLYCDLILNSLGDVAKQALKEMNPAKYEYQSEFARHYIAQGQAEGHAKGRTEGRADLVLLLLTTRFGTLSAELRARIVTASADELDAIAQRLLTAPTLDDALAGSVSA